jgi:hypothetical protein
MLSVVLSRKRKKENEDEEFRFEQSMFISNPEMYKNYLKHKEENEENQVVWSTPKTIEEARVVENLFAQAHNIVGTSSNEDADDEFIKQISLLNPFASIDIEKIGDENG